MDVLLLYCFARKVGHVFIALYSVCACHVQSGFLVSPNSLLKQVKTSAFLGNTINVK